MMKTLSGGPFSAFVGIRLGPIRNTISVLKVSAKKVREFDRIAHQPQAIETVGTSDVSSVLVGRLRSPWRSQKGRLFMHFRSTTS